MSTTRPAPAGRETDKACTADQQQGERRRLWDTWRRTLDLVPDRVIEAAGGNEREVRNRSAVKQRQAVDSTPIDGAAKVRATEGGAIVVRACVRGQVGRYPHRVRLPEHDLR